MNFTSDAVDAELFVDRGEAGGIQALVDDELRELRNQRVNRFIRH